MSAVARYLAGALAASLAAGALVHLAGPVFGRPAVLAGLLPFLGAAGLLLVQRRAPRAPFRTLAWAAWALGAVLTWVFGASVLESLALQTALLWALRWAWWRRSPLAAAAEAAIAAVGLGAFSWALVSTGSAALALWCWALAHAASLCLAMPEAAPAGDDRWSRARRSAEAALNRFHA